MKYNLILSAVMLLSLLSSLAVGQKQEIFLEVSGLQDKVLISLPENHDLQKRYPVIFYYHGQRMQPDTSLIRAQAGPKHWIVVGMGYTNNGVTDLSKPGMARVMSMFNKVKKVVISKYGGNLNACYVAGFSKGGWLTDAMLQTEPSLAGGIILSAGKMKNFNKIKSHFRGKKSKKKMIFIGIGQKDKNQIYAYHSFLMHRKMGAGVTIEVWRGIEHSFPKEGSRALKQWLKMRTLDATRLKAIAKKEIQEVMGSVQKLSSLEQYFVLRDLSKTPYVKLLGSDWRRRIGKSIDRLKKVAVVNSEFTAHNIKQKALLGELTYRNTADLKKVWSSYLSIQKDYAASEEAFVIEGDLKRVEGMIARVSPREAEALKKLAAENAKKAVKGKDPIESDKKRIHRNPFNR